MANLTVTIDERLLRQARIRALEDGPPVNALLRAYLKRHAGAGDAAEGLAAFARGSREHREQRTSRSVLDSGGCP